MHSRMVSARSTSWLESSSMDSGLKECRDGSRTFHSPFTNHESRITNHALIARGPVRQPVIAHAVFQPLAMHLQHADEEFPRVARVDDVLGLVEPRQVPRGGV